MTELASFSDWVLALFPRLFLYPGGVWMLAALLFMRLTSRGPASLKPVALASDLLKDSLPPLALAWTTLALTPLPSASLLSTPIDRFVLCALALLSMLVGSKVQMDWEGWINIGLALAVLAPLASGIALMGTSQAASISGVLSMLAVTLGLAALSSEIGRSLSHDVRWLVWLGLGFAPLWAASEQLSLPGLLWVSMVYVVVIALFTLASKLSRSALYNREWTIFAVWGTATLALLVALLGG